MNGSTDGQRSPWLARFEGVQAVLFARLWTGIGWLAGILFALVVFLAPYAIWVCALTLVRKWLNVPQVLFHPMVMMGVATVLGVLNARRLQAKTESFGRFVENLLPIVITVRPYEFALGKMDDAVIEIREPGTYLIRPGVRIWFQGSQDEYDHFDPLGQ